LLLHIGVFQIDVDSKRVSPWHQLTPQTRVLCALLFVFATALTPIGQWITWGVYAVALAIAILFGRVTLSVLLKRVAVEFAFLAAIFLGTLFHAGDTVLWSWGWFQITAEGLTILGSVMLRAMLSLLMLNFLVLTTSAVDLLNALVVLKMPPLLVAIMASMYRYIGLLIDEFTAMKRAAESRNLMTQGRWRRLIFGHMIGALFIRTYERGDRVHQAMLSRGYSGTPKAQAIAQSSYRDPLALSLMAAVLLLGQILFLVS
jgi:cobalt/nickel transport system permease protein